MEATQRGPAGNLGYVCVKITEIQTIEGGQKEDQHKKVLKTRTPPNTIGMHRDSRVSMDELPVGKIGRLRGFRDSTLMCLACEL